MKNTSPASRAEPVVDPKELTRALADLSAMRPGPGLVRVLMGVTLYLAFVAAALASNDAWAFLAFALLATVVGASLIITTHDGIHHTLTGWAWFDELAPRLMSMTILWPHGVYSELHKLHHKMNGADPLDPERTQWTDEEYDRAGPFGRFLARHQFALAVFLYGGVGLIVSALKGAIRFAPRSKGIRRQLWLDGALIVAFNANILAVMFNSGFGWKYLALWVILERVGGGLLQFRAHILHFGLWGKEANFFETQIFNSRNIRTNTFTSWYFVHLNFHSVHHAFPTVPFYNLREAHSRLRRLYSASEGRRELIEDTGYFQTALRLVRGLHLARTR